MIHEAENMVLSIKNPQSALCHLYYSRRNIFADAACGFSGETGIFIQLSFVLPKPIQIPTDGIKTSLLIPDLRLSRKNKLCVCVGGVGGGTESAMSAHGSSVSCNKLRRTCLHWVMNEQRKAISQENVMQSDCSGHCDTYVFAWRVGRWLGGTD